jgi:hypothetical protein
LILQNPIFSISQHTPIIASTPQSGSRGNYVAKTMVRCLSEVKLIPKFQVPNRNLSQKFDGLKLAILMDVHQQPEKTSGTGKACTQGS